MKMHRIPPCAADPESWDLDPSLAPHPPVEQLVNACLSQCPALALCRQLDRGDCYGVVAGEFRPWPDAKSLAAAFRSGTMSRVITGVRASIANAHPGTVLPGAQDLARLYGCSDTTVRSALRWLAEQHVLTPPVNRHHWYQVPERSENAA